MPRDNRYIKDGVHDEVPGGAVCPYYKAEKRGYLYCEAVRITFPDRASRGEIRRRLCYSPTGYKECPFKQAMDNYYDRAWEKAGREAE